MDIFKTWIATKPIAHRGLHSDTNPENSLGAFEAAAVKGFPIELDVHLLSDGTVAVFHDDTLARMTYRDGYLCNLKLEDLAEIKLGKTDAHIPTLEETLELVNGRVPILIEIKNDGAVGALEKALLNILKTYEGEFAVQSFNPYSLEYFKNYAPHIMRGQLSCKNTNKNLSFSKRRALTNLRYNKRVSCPHFIAYGFWELPNRAVTAARHARLPILGWTIRSNDDYEKSKDYVDNIIFERYQPDREE